MMDGYTCIKVTPSGGIEDEKKGGYLVAWQWKWEQGGKRLTKVRSFDTKGYHGDTEVQTNTGKD